MWWDILEPKTSWTGNIEDISPQIGLLLLKKIFYSEYDSSEYHLHIWTSWILFYHFKNEEKILLWVKQDSEFWIWKIINVSSLGYFTWENWLIWMDLDTGEIHSKLLFNELGIGNIEKVAIIDGIVFWKDWICKFRKERLLTMKTMGKEIADKIHPNTESWPIEWKYTANQLWIWDIQEIFSDFYGTIVVGKLWIAVCNNGKILCQKTYSELGIEKAVQIYKNWWIIGKNESIQLDFKSGEIIIPISMMDISEFLNFQKKNSHYQMEHLRWQEIPQKPKHTIIQGIISWWVQQLITHELP